MSFIHTKHGSFNTANISHVENEGLDTGKAVVKVYDHSNVRICRMTCPDMKAAAAVNMTLASLMLYERANEGSHYFLDVENGAYRELTEDAHECNQSPGQ